MKHPLFELFPLNSRTTISVGEVPTPYQIYEGHGVFIGGTANLSKIEGLLASENVYPIQDTDGRALMGIWVVDFTHASLGPHNELQFSILVSHHPTLRWSFRKIFRIHSSRRRRVFDLIIQVSSKENA